MCMYIVLEISTVKSFHHMGYSFPIFSPLPCPPTSIPFNPSCFITPLSHFIPLDFIPLPEISHGIMSALTFMGTLMKTHTYLKNKS